MQGVGKGIKRYGNSKQSPGMLLATDRRDPISNSTPDIQHPSTAITMAYFKDVAYTLAIEILYYLYRETAILTGIGQS